MNTLRTLREKETRLPIMPLDCSPGMWCSTARRLTRGVLGWDTLGGPDPGIFDALGGPDRRAGEDHPAGPGGQRAPRHHGAHHQLLHPGSAHPGRPADHLPRLRHGFLFQYPSLFVAHVARFPDTAAAFTSTCRPQAKPHRPAAAAAGRTGAEHE